MSELSDVWDGYSGDDLVADWSCMTDVKEGGYTSSYFDQYGNVFGDSQCGYGWDNGINCMRWNVNTKSTRKKVCWVCGVETSDYYQHKWRTQDGRIANIKCSCCYDRYVAKSKKEDGYGKGL
ncbi:hypothetical protein CL634_07025 [bacterium]|nr:hypothetical protein [bacterium]